MTLDSKNNEPMRIGIWLLFPTVLGLAITHQSLWMDEGSTVWFASHKSIASFFSNLVGSRGAPGDPQMIFYLLYVWAWIKVWGASEAALRAANIPFAVLLLAAVRWASCRLFGRPYAWLLVCLSPFVWFYMNEARPYMAVMSFSAVAVVAMLAYLMDRDTYRVAAPWFCLLAVFLAWGSHIVGAFLVPSLVFMIAVTARQEPALRKQVLNDWYPASLICLPAFVTLGMFYLWTSANGVNFTSGVPGLANLAFVAYEFLGFAGLGPPRQELRTSLQPYMAAHYWPWLLVGGAVASAGCLMWLYTRPNRLTRNLAASLAVGLLIALAVSRIAHLQLLGRHVAMFFPMLLLFFLLWASTSPFPRSGKYLGATLTAVGIIWGISDARLVLLPEYEKDSYRAASSISRMRARMGGADILWAADPRTAYYYGLPAESRALVSSKGQDIRAGFPSPDRDRAIDVQQWTLAEATAYLSSRTAAAILVMNRPDLFDERATWRTLIDRQKPLLVASPPGFQIYEWQAPDLTTAMAPLSH